MTRRPSRRSPADTRWRRPARASARAQAAGGIPLPATAPTQVPASGPSFNVLQSGQFVNFTNNQNTLGGQLRLNETTLANGGHRLTGDVTACPAEGRSTSTRSPRQAPRLRSREPSAASRSTPASPALRRLRARPRRGRREHPGHVRPVPGLDLLRKQVLDPRHGRRRSALLVRRQATRAGHLLEQERRRVRRREVRQGRRRAITATANDLQLQKVTVIPLNVATPVPSTASQAKPALTTPSGLSPAGEKFTATKSAQTSTRSSPRCSSRSRSCSSSRACSVPSRPGSGSHA